ncbi:hypothetical protein CRV15_28365 (plasmid) [Streptomyces clavuligerus]|uniref:Uncharacterized protein n=1 Tax=Streptomyces clavuligerus TaxID=1901 RepID=B5GVS1_STRCL|nr:hypothetical protein SSCG_03564 [Streptomyces clavuligerus]EFG03540.1 Hypothetical protein SCLAV_p0045 [Streptomyces clavuligerus]QCS10871.1 hypothetical protein CRV15_28365 [Streptomyces clavuligerus]QPJ98532.1 hypothetical protein GE265_35945 [Streptomyces clavuligerus]
MLCFLRRVQVRELRRTDRWVAEAQARSPSPGRGTPRHPGPGGMPRHHGSLLPRRRTASSAFPGLA